MAFQLSRLAAKHMNSFRKLFSFISADWIQDLETKTLETWLLNIILFLFYFGFFGFLSYMIYHFSSTYSSLLENLPALINTG